MLLQRTMSPALRGTLAHRTMTSKQVSTWKQASFIAVPALSALTAIFVWRREKAHWSHYERPEWVEYPWLNIRKRPFPWEPTGKKTLGLGVGHRAPLRDYCAYYRCALLILQSQCLTPLFHSSTTHNSMVSPASVTRKNTPNQPIKLYFQPICPTLFIFQCDSAGKIFSFFFLRKK